MHDSTFKVNILVDIDDYVEQHCKLTKKPKTLADKRRWVKDQGLKLVRNPTTKKEAVPMLDKTIMLTGNRMSASKTREESFASKSESKASFKKMSADLDVGTNTKATRASLSLLPPAFVSVR